MTITVKQVDLKACPVCGGGTRATWGRDGDYQWHYVACLGDTCRVIGPQRDTEAEAIEAWNRRPSITNEQIEAAARAIMKRAGETANADESEEWFAEQFARAALSTLEVR